MKRVFTHLVACTMELTRCHCTEPSKIAPLGVAPYQSFRRLDSLLRTLHSYQGSECLKPMFAQLLLQTMCRKPTFQVVSRVGQSSIFPSVPTWCPLRVPQFVLLCARTWPKWNKPGHSRLSRLASRLFPEKSTC